jgi:hypothetical protein
MKNSYLTLILMAMIGCGAFLAAQSVPVHLDPSQLYHYEGVVASIQAAPGSGAPLFVLQTADGSEVTFQTGPYWFFDVAGFVLAEGDNVAVDAFASIDPTITLYYAARIQNLDTGAVIILRDDSGVPQWTGGRHFGGQGNGGPSGQNPGNGNGGDGSGDGSGRGGSRGNGQGGDENGQGGDENGQGGASSFALENIQVVTGTVTVTSLALGQKDSSFILTDGSGAAWDIRVGPFWFLAANGFTLSVGDSVEATVASRASDPLHLFALQIKNLTTGATVVLRDDYGFPLWRR